MKSYSAPIIALALCATGLSRDQLIPFDDFFVSVETSDWLNRGQEGAGLCVDVSVSRNADHPEGSTSCQVNCFEFNAGQVALSEADVNAFVQACRAAKNGREYLKEIVARTDHGEQKTIHEVVSMDGRSVVRMTRGEETATFLPSEADRVTQALAEAKAGEGWFKKLLVAGKMPEKTRHARPPQAQGYHLESTLGEVSCRGISFEISVWSSQNFGIEQEYSISHRLRFSLPRGGGSMAGRWVEELLARISLALESIRKGREYSYSHDLDDEKYTLTANLATKEADLVLYPPGKFFNKPAAQQGHVGESQLAEIRKLIKEADERKNWFKDHEHLFFSSPTNRAEQAASGDGDRSSQ